MVLISRVGSEKLKRFKKESSNISSSHFFKPRLNGKGNRFFQSNGSGRKEKKNQKKKSSPLLSTTIFKCELLFRRSYVLQYCLDMKKLSMTNSWADLFFFKFKLVVIWFFTREPFIVTDKCDYRKLIPSLNWSVSSWFFCELSLLPYLVLTYLPKGNIT